MQAGKAREGGHWYGIDTSKGRVRRVLYPVKVLHEAVAGSGNRDGGLRLDPLHVLRKTPVVSACDPVQNRIAR